MLEIRAAGLEYAIICRKDGVIVGQGVVSIRFAFSINRSIVSDLPSELSDIGLQIYVQSFHLIAIDGCT